MSSSSSKKNPKKKTTFWSFSSSSSFDTKTKGHHNKALSTFQEAKFDIRSKFVLHSKKHNKIVAMMMMMSFAVRSPSSRVSSARQSGEAHNNRHHRFFTRQKYQKSSLHPSHHHHQNQNHRATNTTTMTLASSRSASTFLDETSSSSSSSSDLSKLQKVSSVLYDTKSALNAFGELGPQAATVSPAVVLHAIQNANNFDKGALEGALVYAKEKEEEQKEGDQQNTSLSSSSSNSKEETLELVIDKATVNLAAKFASRVEGRVSVEVDAKKSTTAEIVEKTERLMEMFREVNVKSDKLLFKIPATWEGVQAMRELENKGVPCHATLCYCFEQTAAAASANASLIQIYYARINSYGGDALQLARDTMNFIQSSGSPSKILAASIRSAADAKTMAGCDYILCNERVLKELNNGNADGEVVNNVASNASSSMDVDKSLTDSFTKASFENALKSSPADEAIQLQLQNYLAAQKQLETYVEEFVGLNC